MNKGETYSWHNYEMLCKNVNIKQARSPPSIMCNNYGYLLFSRNGNGRTLIFYTRLNRTEKMCTSHKKSNSYTNNNNNNNKKINDI